VPSATGLLHVEERATPQRFALRQLPYGVVEPRSPLGTSPSALTHTDLQDPKLRARYRYGLKQIRSLRLRLGRIFAHAPCWRAGSLIQSASYPRHASNIVCGSKALRRTEHSRLSWRLAIERPVSACWYRATFPSLSCLRSLVLSQPVLSRVDPSAWCSSSPSAGADPHLVSLCSRNCSSKGRTQLFKHGARPQLNRGKVRMFNYGLARRAGKVQPLPGPW
jgi:hypothetical protein